MTYFNEFDPAAALWLEQLFPGNTIDTRSIKDVQSTDVMGLHRAHFFAGIGGWEYALELAEVPTDLQIWTGSCPCQPFSVAGKGTGEADPRHLWPEFRRLIDKCHPSIVFGEQVASKDGRLWLDGVRVDLERMGYAVGAADLCAAGVGAPHIRQRLYWGAIRLRDTDDKGSQRLWSCVSSQSGHGGGGKQVSKTGRQDSIGMDSMPMLQRRELLVCDTRGTRIGMPVPADRRMEGGPLQHPGKFMGFWANYDVLPYRGTARRVEPGLVSMAEWFPKGMGQGSIESLPIEATPEARTMRLKGYGNAIVPQLAAVFIQSFLESIGVNP